MENTTTPAVPEINTALNIQQRMSAASAEIDRVPKNLIVGTGKNQYKAVAEADILRAVKQAESAHGIFSYPVAHEIVDSHPIINHTDYGDKESQFVRVKAVYRFTCIEKPTEYLDVSAFGDGVDSLDKAPGKATTYADKYALMKAYKVETGDDTDRTASDDLEGHDIWKIKERVDRLMTAKMQHGMTQDDLMKALGMSQRQYDTCINSFKNVSSFESRLKQL